ncbi:unnamed protein product [Rotaria sordida]|uniref:Uncharacterized protein n=1 Tax=Rotaria sordida TaxID=392033 RepID=A0A815I8A5_9BILA|nr:unnamed protein product [Rotaria sordida]CAF1362167.1 unnamed protein product [Rotaria sordida]
MPPPCVIETCKPIINDIKHDIDQYEENGILVDVHPLIINNNLIYIEKWTVNEIDISTLSSLYRTIDCSNGDWPVLTSNNRFLLLNQYPNVCLFDKELTIVKQCPWEYDRIPDMCWSSTLNCFIMDTNKNEVFQVNENLILIQSIETIEKKEWLSCTCSDVSLFLTTNDGHSGIFEFNLLSSFCLIKQRKFPQICNKDEFIHNIAYNNGTLALLISYQSFKYDSSKTVRIEVRSSSTLDQLWSLPLNIAYQDGRVNRTRTYVDEIRTETANQLEKTLLNQNNVSTVESLIVNDKNKLIELNKKLDREIIPFGHRCAAEIARQTKIPVRTLRIISRLFWFD